MGWDGRRGNPPCQAVRDFLRCGACALGADSGTSPDQAALPHKALALSRVADAAQDAGVLDDAESALADCHILPGLVRAGYQSAAVHAVVAER